MKATIYLLISAIATTIGCSSKQLRQTSVVQSTCSCDTTKTKQEINKTSFNKIPQYDTVSFTRAMFYDLDPLTNKMLWYRDIENPDTTKFTKLWNDYVPGTTRSRLIL